MATSNGLGPYPATNTNAPPRGADEGPVVQVNFGLTARHIWTGITAIVTTVSAACAALATAGWLVLPAKQSDLTRVETGLQAIGVEVRRLNEVNGEVVTAVRELRDLVADMQRSPPAGVRPRQALSAPAPVKPRQAPKPAAGLFGW